MEIRISEKEITAGVVAYLNSRGFNLDPATVKIDYTVGRKPAGVTAVLIEGDEVVEAPAPKAEVLTGQANTSGAVGTAGVADPAPAPEVTAEAPVEASVDSAPTEAVATASVEEGTSLFK